MTKWTEYASLLAQELLPIRPAACLPFYTWQVAPPAYNLGMFNARAWNIALRTAHLAAMGVLLGGHAFDVAKSDLLPSLWFCAVTGVALGALEAGLRPVWFHQGRGLMTVVKLGLLCAVPFCWTSWHLRIAILLMVVVIASVGSHMPARFRYYSVLYGEVIRCYDGPGVTQLFADEPDGPDDDKQRQDEQDDRNR